MTSATDKIFLNIAPVANHNFASSVSFYQPAAAVVKKAKSSHGSFAIRRSASAGGAAVRNKTPAQSKVTTTDNEKKKSVKFNFSSTPTIVDHTTTKSIEIKSSNSNTNAAYKLTDKLPSENKHSNTFKSYSPQKNNNFNKPNNTKTFSQNNQQARGFQFNRRSNTSNDMRSSSNDIIDKTEQSVANNTQTTTLKSKRYIPKVISSTSASEVISQPQSVPSNNSFGSKGKTNVNNVSNINPKVHNKQNLKKNNNLHESPAQPSSQGHGPISSLFKGNPEIPLMQPDDVTPITEEVFSTQDFSSLNISKVLVSHMDKLGYKSLTMVQQRGIPPISQGKDVLIKSQTGSGKTLTYTLPIVNALYNITPQIERSHGVMAIIVVPTRELALQTFQWVQEMCKACVFIVPGFLIGGEKKKSEKNRMRRGMNILVATPGRLLDHIQTTQCLKLSAVKYLVLDEADRMLEMGYEKSVASIIEAVRDAKLYGDERRHKNTFNANDAPIGTKRKATESTDEGNDAKKAKHEEEEDSDSEGEVAMEDVDDEEEAAEAASKGKYCSINLKSNSENQQSTSGFQHGSPPYQTVMVSATLTPKVQHLAGLSLHSPVVISVSGDSDAGVIAGGAVITPQSLTHHYTIVPAKQRLVTLSAFILSKCLLRGVGEKILIFMATQDMVDYHTTLFKLVLARYGKVDPVATEQSELEAEAEKVLASVTGGGSNKPTQPESNDAEEKEKTPLIHFLQLRGNMTQSERTAVFKQFREAVTGVLLCTDVGARGLDLPLVSWIVQYNAPTSVTDYVHRVGRTSRANTRGDALLMLAPSEAGYIQHLNEHKITIKEMNSERILQNLTTPPPEMDPGFRVPRSLEQGATFLQGRYEHLLLSSAQVLGLARKAYVSFIGAYTSYPNKIREIFNFKSLHLGHFAKSFGLREAPSALGAGATFKAQRMHRNKKEKRERVAKAKFSAVIAQKRGAVPKMASVSEFDSGLDGLSRLVKKNKQDNMTKGQKMNSNRDAKKFFEHRNKKKEANVKKAKKSKEAKSVVAKKKGIKSVKANMKKK